MEYKHYLIGLALFLLGLTGYHYYAASQAAGQIDEALQEQSSNPTHPFSISYSDIEVHPFAGDILVHDLAYKQEGVQSIASSLTLDMTYLDFLRFYIGGSDFGLKKLHNSSVIAIQPSIEFPSINSIVATDTLDFEYEGQMYDLLRYAVAGYPLEQSHQLASHLKTTRYTQTGTTVGEFTIDRLTLETDIPAESNSLLQAENFTATGKSITWTPPAAFASQYEFFIRGFGYEPDSVGLDSLALQITAADERPPVKNMRFNLFTDLFQLQATASLIVNNSSPNSWIFRDGRIGIPEISEQFENFLNNSEQLFGISIPDRRNLLQFSGPISSPEYSLDGGSE